MKYLFKGSAVALITPFKDGGIDYDSLGKLIDYQLENKTDGIVVLGTTGEPATISDKDKREIISFAKNKIGGKAKLIVGTGANSTRKAIENSVMAKELGADGLLIVTPYYNKCSMSGLVEHYKVISESVDDLPIIVYNVPGRTGVNITPEVAVELSNIPNIVGIKEASGNISQIVALTSALKDKMAVYSGDDALNYVFMTLGALGCISVTANILPKKVKSVIDLCLASQYAEALLMHEKLLDINKTMFVDVNPIPVKYACSLLKMCESEIRLPLSLPSENNQEKIKHSLQTFFDLQK